MSHLDTIDTGTLASELQARRERDEAEQAERQRQTEATEQDRYRRVIAEYPIIEAAKLAATDQYRSDFTAAVAASDLPAAFAAWMGERSTRFFRTGLRDQYRTALRKTGDTTTAVAELRYYHPDLLKRLEEEGDRQARMTGYEEAETLFD